MNLKTWKVVSLLALIAITASGYAEALSLQDCRDLSLKNAECMSIARLGVESGTALKKASFTAFLPSLNAMGTYMHSGKTFEYKEDLNLQQLLGGMAQANPAVTSDLFYQTLTALFQQGMISDEIDLQLEKKTIGCCG
jgi:outer membrane protein TolC